MKYNPPQIDNEFICIVNRNDNVLAALIASYIFKLNKYNLIFEFPSVTAEYRDFIGDVIDEHHITRVRANEFNIKVNNAINQVHGCKYLIIAGLNEEQKSYLTFLEDYNVIEIQDYYDVEVYLSAFNLKSDIIICREEEVLNGLYIAAKSDAILKIDDNAESILSCKLEKSNGIIVIEDIKKVSSVIATIYALSLNLSISITPKVIIDKREISYFIEQWKTTNNGQFFNDLRAIVYPNIEHIDFEKYEFATFFTTGIPYSLIIENIIPCSHVNLYINPDFFVFNSIYFQNKFQLNSAIVFSPKEFEDEETDFVIQNFASNNYYVRGLIGEKASANSLDFHIKEFPFDLLHICSHGGEIGGYESKLDFIDRDGNKHIVEFDEVVTYDLTTLNNTNLDEGIPVTVKNIYKKFDGLIWRSKELKDKNFPNYVFSDMQNAISNGIDKTIRKPKRIIANSCAITCYSSYYQAMFNIIAGIHSPIIFNNTCWSWSDIADHFIASGARGYIGTLWDVDNGVAKKSAEHFYSNIFSKTIMNALHDSLIYSKEKREENIYIYYGLHFSSFSKAISVNKSKEEVIIRLITSLERWKDKLKNTRNESIKRNIKELLKWNASILATDFKDETISIIKNQYKKRE
ncbi:hypothetical protein KUL118_67450 [Tenacibaculum sp. KUL118]|nr:hypothetical protein KUL118_67450 [Tenacibaculum sp. KUL118]